MVPVHLRGAQPLQTELELTATALEPLYACKKTGYVSMWKQHSRRTSDKAVQVRGIGARLVGKGSQHFPQCALGSFIQLRQ